MADDPRVRRVLKDLAAHEPARAGLGRFELLGTLGEGATATVHRARDASLGREVALKVLRASRLTETLRERFRREARAMAGLSHPNIVAVFDADAEADPPWIAMELVEGRPFGEAPGDTGVRLRLLEQAARGVAAAHARGIVHRDLKPANLLVAGDGTPKVGDFGLAHALDTRSELTRTGTTLGTPLYMAPEQVEGRPDAVGPATDVYALGAMLYEILAGRPPVQADGLAELYRRIVAEEPAPPPGPADAARVAMKALDKDPARRYPDAGAFADDLKRHLDGEPVLARPAGPAGRLWRRALRHRRVLLLALGAAGALLAAGVSWRQSVRLREELARLAPDPRPWRPVFDGTSTACFLAPDAPGWRFRDGALENAVPNPPPLQTVQTFGNEEVRVRFRSERQGYLGISARIATTGGWAAEFDRGRLERLPAVEHVLVFRPAADGVSAELDGAPVPVRASGVPGTRGTIHVSCVGGTFRLLAIESR